jgi:alpha-L-fucosidase
MAAMARKNQPGIIIVDRDVHGPFENYRTPEQRVPDKPLLYPWETCITMATSWSYVPDDTYKPPRQLIHLLVDVVAKGGNLLLNVGPSPNGELPPQAYERMRDIGAWLKVNGEAIYETRPIEPYIEGKLRFTSLKDGTVFAIYLADEGERELPATISLTGITTAQNARMELLGSNARLTAKRVGNAMIIDIPESIRRSTAGQFAWTIKISRIGQPG